MDSECLRLAQSNTVSFQNGGIRPEVATYAHLYVRHLIIRLIQTEADIFNADQSTKFGE